MYTHSPDPSKQYAILRKIRGSRDQAIPGYFAPQEQIPWVRGCTDESHLIHPVTSSLAHNLNLGGKTFQGKEIWLAIQRHIGSNYVHYNNNNA